MHATKESLLNALKTVAEEQGPDVTLFQFRELTGISRHVVADRWGNWTTLRAAAGLPVRPRLKPVYSDEQLLAEYHHTAVQLDDFPTQSEFSRLSDRSWLTLERRFGHSAEVQAEYRQWLSKQPRDAQPKFLRNCPEGCVPSIVPGLYVYEPKPGRFFNLLVWLMLSLAWLGGSATPLPSLANVNSSSEQGQSRSIQRRNPPETAGFDSAYQDFFAGRITDPAPDAPSGWKDTDSKHSQSRGLVPEPAGAIHRVSEESWWEALPDRKTIGCPSELHLDGAPQRLRQIAGHRTLQRQPAGQRFSSSWKQSFIREQNSQREMRWISKRDLTSCRKIKPLFFTELLESRLSGQRLCKFYQFYEPGLCARQLEPGFPGDELLRIRPVLRRYNRLLRRSTTPGPSGHNGFEPTGPRLAAFQTGQTGKRALQFSPNLRATCVLSEILGKGLLLSKNQKPLPSIKFLTIFEVFA